jgi:predicted amidohydrolase YtcJ
MWVMNSAALSAIGQGDHPDGRLLGVDEELRARIPLPPPDLVATGCRLAAYGVTAVYDATPTERIEDIAALLGAHESGALPQRVVVSGGPGLALDVARRAGAAAGPVKLVVADHALPTVEDLVAGVLAARRAGRCVAVHAVTRVALVLAVAAWRETGAEPGDRVEHGGVVPPELAGDLAALGVTVVTQPSFVRERGDRYLREVDAVDRGHLYPCAGLIASGVRVAGSSDAPFGDPDPWRAIATAIDRRTRRGATVGDGERVPPQRALELFLGDVADPGGPPRRVRAGAPADLCLLAVPLRDALREPTSSAVRATICAGQLAFAPQD